MACEMENKDLYKKCYKLDLIALLTQNEENNFLETYVLNVMFISPCIRTTNNKYGKCYTSDYD